MAPHSGAHHGAAPLDIRPGLNSTQAGPSASEQPSTSLSGSTSPLPSISLPKGGGSISGMGEKFNVNAATGTGSSSIPIRTSPSRGVSPGLSLNYSSGNGNGPFGLGWSLSETSITRKTSKGLPQYYDNEDSDVFLLGGMEDLVPIFRKDQQNSVLYDSATRQPILHEESQNGFRIRRYSSRIEGSFIRIERWISLADPEDVHWRVTSPDNTTSVYGTTPNTRLFDPNQGPNQKSRIFSWLLSEQYDMKGNAVIYEYKEEDTVGIPYNATNERNRTEKSRSANRYLKTIKYGNKTPCRDPETWHSFSAFQNPADDWMFTVILDYGEFDEENPKFDDNKPWHCRKDPFSSYRSGFEIRTYRLCKRILMFHNFPTELSRDHYLVSSTSFEYTEEYSITYLKSAIQTSYMLDGDKLCSKSLPPVDFEYSTFPKDEVLVERSAQDIDPISTQNMPSGVDGYSHRWADLDGEGLSGVLIEQGRGWFYKRNQSANNTSSNLEVGPIAPAFGPLEEIFSKPSMALGRGRAHFSDVQGDGLLDLVEMDDSAWGFFSRKVLPDRGWAPFQEFKARPNIRFDQFATFVDVTGDGLADIFITEDNAFVYYPSLGEDGFGEPNRIFQALDEEKGPRLLLGDAEQTIHLADMSGDGLTDLIRIRNGEVCYWPNTGYGHFGAKVTLDDSPWFDNEGSYNPSYLHVADIDGSGTSDLFYISPDGIDIYLNNSGNSFSPRKRLSHVIPVDRFSTVDTVDILGNGTTCIVWSSLLPGQSQISMKYIDLSRGKPHLLIGQKNNFGSETRIHYAPSTKFYLDDKQAGRHWITALPFPVQCVEKVETFERISGNRFASRYAYHHGFFDGFEREFRGFAMVEQWDTEGYEGFSSTSATNLDRKWQSPPVHTKSWFSTGNFLGEGSSLLALDYFEVPESHESANGLATTLLEDSVLPSGLNINMTREACRALKGHVLRSEVYSDDKSPKADIPYNIAESNYTVRALQPEDVHGHGILHVVPRESINLSFERNLGDPRIQHGLAVEIDKYGNSLKSVQIAYGRHSSPLPEAEDRKCQEQLLITYSEGFVTNHIDEPDCYRLPVPCESRSYQLYGYENDLVDRFGLSQFSRNELAHLPTIPFEANPNGRKQKRLLGRSRSLLRSDDLTHLLPLGVLESMAFPGESYTQVFTPGLLETYQRPNLDSLDSQDEILIHDINNVLGNKGGGHVDLDGDGNWWVPSGRSYFHFDPVPPAHEVVEARNHFFLTRRFVDPFGNQSRILYDQFDLLPTESIDALRNVVRSSHDYRVLQAYLTVDPNGNRSQCAFDELGYVVASAIMGKEGEDVGDSLDIFCQATSEEVDQFFLDPHGPLGEALLGNATTRTIYNVDRYWKEMDDAKKMPVFYAIIARETHASDPAAKLKTQIGFYYFDGIGRTIQAKAQAKSKDAKQNWITSGWTIVNNKGNPVRKFEPFFDKSHEYISDQKVGVSSVLLYDAMDRVIAQLAPNHTFTKTVFDNWTSRTYDANDTVLLNPKTDPDISQFVILLPDDYYLPTWYEKRISNQLGRDAKLIASKAAKHANTPITTHLDVLGRAFLSIADNGSYGQYSTRSTLDISGRILRITDAKGRLVQTYSYNMSGSPIYEQNLEAGARWTMFDIGGGILLHWDARGNRFRTQRDELGRVIGMFLLQGYDGGAGKEKMIEKVVYGESLSLQGRNRHETITCFNARGRVVKSYDQAGVRRNVEFDFKGNLLYSDRRLAREYKSVLDWRGQVQMEEEVYVFQNAYDALNRCVEFTSADDSVVYHFFDEAGYLQRVEGRIRDEEKRKVFVKNTEYNARGQKTCVEYGNGTQTSYEYDPNTFALIHLLTKRDERKYPGDEGRSRDSAALTAVSHAQNLRYTFDAVGNVMKIVDRAQQTIFHKGEVVEPSNEFTYDPLYRLVDATGREHLSLAKKPTVPGELFDPVEHKNDGRAMSRYAESYGYDEVGNLLWMRHENTSANVQGWTRHYHYDEPNLLEPGALNNRLSHTTIGSATEYYRYEGNAAHHGNITSMPNIRFMSWDFFDQLHATSRSLGRDGSTPETTYYVYDSSGSRVRKVTESHAAPGETPRRIKERIYAGTTEFFRRFNGQGEIKLERQTLHVGDGSRTVTLIETRIAGEEKHVPEQIFRYQLENHIGSVSLELDDEARVLTYEEYTPYGATSYEAAGATIGAPKRYGYTGKERDGENGLYYYGRRYYCPATARWVNCDPIGIESGLDGYVYVRCNPINLNDPDGCSAMANPNTGPGGEMADEGDTSSLDTSSSSGGKTEREEVESDTSTSSMGVQVKKRRESLFRKNQHPTQQQAETIAENEKNLKLPEHLQVFHDFAESRAGDLLKLYEKSKPWEIWFLAQIEALYEPFEKTGLERDTKPYRTGKESADFGKPNKPNGEPADPPHTIYEVKTERKGKHSTLYTEVMKDLRQYYAIKANHTPGTFTAMWFAFSKEAIAQGEMFVIYGLTIEVNKEIGTRTFKIQMKKFATGIMFFFHEETTPDGRGDAYTPKELEELYDQRDHEKAARKQEKKKRARVANDIQGTGPPKPGETRTIPIREKEEKKQ